MTDMSRLAAKQQALLAALFGPWDVAALRGAVDQPDALRLRGLRAYRSNGQALAERALGAAFPVVAQLLGDENFGAVARAFWHTLPPTQGDVARWGDRLAGFIAGAPQLADEPYLPDVARVEWALHMAATAPDAPYEPATFGLLLERDPGMAMLVHAPGLHLVPSRWPVATIVNAHLASQPGLAVAAERLRDGVAETALVWRDGFKPRMRETPPGEAALLAALRGGHPLAAALECAAAVDSAFDFNAWLAPAVQDGLVTGARPFPSEEKTR